MLVNSKKVTFSVDESDVAFDTPDLISFSVPFISDSLKYLLLIGCIRILFHQILP